MSKKSRNSFIEEIFIYGLNASRFKPEQWSYEVAIAVATTQSYLHLPARFKKHRFIRLLAIRRDPWQMEYIPEKERDYELYLMAVSADARTLKIVPEEFLTEEICRIVICSDYLADAYRYLPESYRKQRMLASVAVTHNAWNLVHVPREVIDEKMCLTAIKNDPSIIVHIPTKFLNEEIFFFVYQNPDPYKDLTITYEGLPSEVHRRWAEWQLQQQAR